MSLAQGYREDVHLGLGQKVAQGWARKVIAAVKRRDLLGRKRVGKSLSIVPWPGFRHRYFCGIPHSLPAAPGLCRQVLGLSWGGP